MAIKTPKHFTVEEESRFQAIITVMKPANAYTVAQAVGKQTPGISWKGTNKARMAEYYAKSNLTFPMMYHLDLDVLASDIAKLNEEKESYKRNRGRYYD